MYLFKSPLLSKGIILFRWAKDLKKKNKKKTVGIVSSIGAPDSSIGATSRMGPPSVWDVFTSVWGHKFLDENKIFKQALGAFRKAEIDMISALTLKM